LELSEKFITARKDVHAALCDNIDTDSSLDAIRELISHSNFYIRDHQSVNVQLLEEIAIFITDMLRVFETIPESKSRLDFQCRHLVMAKQP